MLKILYDFIGLTLAIFCYLALVISLPIILIIFLAGTTVPIKCERPAVVFGSHIYRIELCNTWQDPDAREDYYLLRVYHHEKDELLARRRFMMLDNDQVPIWYIDAGILYTDSMKINDLGKPEVKFLALPPSRWDWFTANLIRIAYEP
ncbi:hypothetical protein [Cupriavidus sp. SW-Y-13]|uniref:hypothetical protein n=1 Tax=Cupriavidus sp. SW-Y-13 TaxID=2653854 RepID=UPI00136632DB|nr:hypothetical protein [Cupriavidus sp. SW-Y-13]MWL86335.1 hypothetical protein [Cupriavidus sp. SW-Y-13]